MRFALLALLGFSACKHVSVPETVGPTVTAPANLHLRNAFDTDPSLYLGRFVPTDAASIDESSAMQLTCSQHITYKAIGGGGVVYDELFNASSEAALHIGVPLTANLNASGGRTAVVRVRYELTDKMVAVLDDPAAFEACCKAAPDQCTTEYIGEFLAGKGSVYYEVSQGAGGDASGMTPQGTGDIEIKSGVAWKRSVEFPNPVYFAFKTTKNQWAPDGAAAGCGDWTQGPPKSSQGKYFVGISPPTATEADARDAALLSGRQQVVRYVAETVDTGTVQVQSTTGATDALSTTIQRDTVLQSASSGVAKLVKDESWCVEPEATPGGQIYVAKVLLFLPKEDEAAAATKVVEAAGAGVE